MKKSIIITLSLAIAILFSQANNIEANTPSTVKSINEVMASLTGKWSNNNHFTLELTQSGSSLSGSHCHSTGTRHDCADYDETTISGSGTPNKSFNVRFYSTYAGAYGYARITVIDANTIRWEITTSPQGECYLPQSTILKRQGGSNYGSNYTTGTYMVNVSKTYKHTSANSNSRTNVYCINGYNDNGGEQIDTIIITQISGNFGYGSYTNSYTGKTTYGWWKLSDLKKIH